MEIWHFNVLFITLFQIECAEAQSLKNIKYVTVQILTVCIVCPPQPPAEGASISVYAATASEMEGVGGCYLYNGQKTKSSDSSYDSELQAEMWKKSCELVGL